MEADNLSIGLAFMAGLVSFISPCVLPLVPAYVGYMGGRATTEADKESRNQFGTFIHGIFFVLGFTFFFVGFGLLTSAAADFLNDIGIDIPRLLTRLGGVAVILFGLYVMKALDPLFNRLLTMTNNWKKDQTTAIMFTVFISSLMLGYFYWAFGAEGIQSAIWAIILFLIVLAFFRKPLNEAESVSNFWYRAIMSLQVALITDTRKQMSIGGGENQGYFGSLGMGVVFSAGWTPCIGPVYGAVLTLASDSAVEGGSLLSPALMLTAYSLGLGIPFLLTALAFNQSTSLMGKLKSRMHTVELVSGVLLIVIGVLILSGGLTDLSARFGNEGELGDISYRIEECTAGVFSGRISSGSYIDCVRDGQEKLTDRYITAIVKDADSVVARQNYVFDTIENLEDIEIGLEVGKRAPDFTLQTLDGTEISLSDLRGQAVLLNFWATWCGPCRAEMPEFQQIYTLEKERGFTIVAVDFQEQAPQVENFVSEFGLTFTIALDEDGEVSEDYRINSWPTTFLVDGNGIITWVNRGPATVSTLIEQLSEFEPDSDTTAAIIN